MLKIRGKLHAAITGLALGACIALSAGAHADRPTKWPERR